MQKEQDQHKRSKQQCKKTQTIIQKGSSNNEKRMNNNIKKTQVTMQEN
jgi:hypothetical protein